MKFVYFLLLFVFKVFSHFSTAESGDSDSAADETSNSSSLNYMYVLRMYVYMQ
jgi:hypothetical protein